MSQPQRSRIGNNAMETVAGHFQYWWHRRRPVCPESLGSSARRRGSCKWFETTNPTSVSQSTFWWNSREIKNFRLRPALVNQWQKFSGAKTCLGVETPKTVTGRRVSCLSHVVYTFQSIQTVIQFSSTLHPSEASESSDHITHIVVSRGTLDFL